jgi:hypothetical protein
MEAAALIKRARPNGPGNRPMEPLRSASSTAKVQSAFQIGNVGVAHLFEGLRRQGAPASGVAVDHDTPLSIRQPLGRPVLQGTAEDKPEAHPFKAAA